MRGCRALEPVRDPTRPHEENEIVGAPGPSGIARDVLCMIACAAEGSDGACRGLHIVPGRHLTVRKEARLVPRKLAYRAS